MPAETAKRTRYASWWIGGASAAVAAGVALLGAGCGSTTKSPAVANLGTTSSTTAAPQRTTRAGGSFVPFVNCMNAHGVTATLGPDSHGVSIQGTPGAAQFQAAQSACRHLMPGGGPPALTPAQIATRAKGLAAFAACMRKHGVPGFPDPNGDGELPVASIQQLDPTTTFFESAYKTCQPLFPRIGPQIRFP